MGLPYTPPQKDPSGTTAIDRQCYDSPRQVVSGIIMAQIGPSMRKLVPKQDAQRGMSLVVVSGLGVRFMILVSYQVHGGYWARSNVGLKNLEAQPLPAKEKEQDINSYSLGLQVPPQKVLGPSKLTRVPPNLRFGMTGALGIHSIKNTSRHRCCFGASLTTPNPASPPPRLVEAPSSGIFCPNARVHAPYRAVFPHRKHSKEVENTAISSRARCFGQPKPTALEDQVFLRHLNVSSCFRTLAMSNWSRPCNSETHPAQAK